MTTSTTSTVAWFDASFAGIAGDMALGALLDAGADLEPVRATVACLGLDGWSLDREPVLRAGLAATRAVVDAPEAARHRRWRDIRTLLDRAGLPERVRARSHAVFAALASAEGRLHGTAPDDVHFHEVGALDAIVDVVGTCAALEVLGVDEVRCSPLALGRGTTVSAHGVLPAPAPAVTALLAAVGAPTADVDVDVPAELTTPTGAALMAALAGPGGFGPLPAMTLRAAGFGAGRRDLAGRANATRVVVGTNTAGAVGPGNGEDTAVVIETNVDDVTGEVLAHTIDRLLMAGALDAWVTPIVMKKGRPAHTVAALALPAAVDEVVAVLTSESGSLGVRLTAVGKRRATWTVEQVQVADQPIRVKVTPDRTKVEHDDAARAATSLGLPLREVLRLAEVSARRR